MASAAADTSAIDVNAAAAAPGIDARAKKPVWNVPSNGSIEVGAVMGAVSWPALSESTRPSPKSSSSSDSLKSFSEGTLISSPSPKPTTTAPNPNPVQNPTPLARQKSGKRANGGFAPPPPPPPISTTEVSRNAPDKQAFPEPSPRGAKSVGPEQHRVYGGNRRGNSHSGGSHQGHGNRRDQDWSHHPRGAHVQQQRGGGIRFYPRGVHMQPPPPPVSAPFIGPPPPVRPFVGNAMSFPDMPSPLYFVSPPPPPEPLRGVPFVPQPIPHAMFFPLMDPLMDPQRPQLLKQIDYYFSSENLCKDVFLRQNMDDQGWVPISLIAGFNRVKQLTNNMQYILDTVQLSTIVEIQGDKIRRRNDWMNWLLLPFNHFGPQSLPTADYDGVATRMQNIGLEGAATNHNSIKGPIRGEVFLTRSAFGNLNNQVQVIRDPSVDGNGQFAGFTDSEKTQSTTRSLARSDTL